LIISKNEWYFVGREEFFSLYPRLYPESTKCVLSQITKYHGTSTIYCHDNADHSDIGTHVQTYQIM